MFTLHFTRVISAMAKTALYNQRMAFVWINTDNVALQLHSSKTLFHQQTWHTGASTI